MFYMSSDARGVKVKFCVRHLTFSVFISARGKGKQILIVSNLHGRFLFLLHLSLSYAPSFEIIDFC